MKNKTCSCDNAKLKQWLNDRIKEEESHLNLFDRKSTLQDDIVNVFVIKNRIQVYIKVLEVLG